MIARIIARIPGHTLDLIAVAGIAFCLGYAFASANCHLKFWC